MYAGRPSMLAFGRPPRLRLGGVLAGIIVCERKTTALSGPSRSGGGNSGVLALGHAGVGWALVKREIGVPAFPGYQVVQSRRVQDAG